MLFRPIAWRTLAHGCLSSSTSTPSNGACGAPPTRCARTRSTPATSTSCRSWVWCSCATPTVRYLAVKDGIAAGPADARRPDAGVHEGRFLAKERHLPAAGGPVRSPGRPAGRRGSRRGHHRGDGVDRGGLRQPARRPAEERVPGAGQRRSRRPAAQTRPRRAEAGLRRRLRPHLRVLPDEVRRSEGARRRRVLHAGLAGFPHRPRARSGPRHRARPGLRLRRHVRPERPHREGARRESDRAAHFPRRREERHHHPPGEDEPGRARARRRPPAGDHLLRRPARAARPGRLRDGQSAVQTSTRSMPTRSRPIPASRSACPA